MYVKYNFSLFNTQLAFNCSTLLPFLNVKYTSKLNDQVEDAKQKMMEFLPSETVFKNEQQWVEKASSETFQEPGSIVETYKHGKDEFVIYKTSFKNEAAVRLHNRISILVLLFIEAGSSIDETDENWELFYIFKTSNGVKSFVGFCTAYAYWKFQGSENHDAGELQLNYRKKISQFVILPPYQQQGHGQALYSCMVTQWMQDARVREITVEDPSEAFDDLRDRCDLKRLSSSPAEVWIKHSCGDYKMEKRQFQRCTEMALLHLADIGSVPLREARMRIKRRLYLKNKEALVDLDDATRKDKLHTAYERLEEDYRRIMGKVDLGGVRAKKVKKV